MNDYGIKEYFESWQNLAVNQQTQEVGYQRGYGGYARQVEIEQFKKVTKLPNRFTSSISKSSNSFLPKLSDLEDFEKGEKKPDKKTLYKINKLLYSKLTIN